MWKYKKKREKLSVEAIRDTTGEIIFSLDGRTIDVYVGLEFSFENSPWISRKKFTNNNKKIWQSGKNTQKKTKIWSKKMSS